MAIKPHIYGRIVLEGGGSGIQARLRLEVYGDIFTTPLGAVDARDKPATVEYRVVLEPGRYYSPLEAPLPRPTKPYMLVEASLVYEHEPRYSVVQGGPDETSTTVLTSTAYTMVEGLVYPHILVEVPSVETRIGDEVLVAYPIEPRDERLAEYVRLEYHMLREHSRCPWFDAAIAVCKPGDCVLEELWRQKRGLARLSEIPRCWASIAFGASLDPEPLSLELRGDAARVAGVGVVRLEAECERGEGFVLEGLVEGLREWRLGEGCGIRRYSSLCPLCSLPP